MNKFTIPTEAQSKQRARTFVRNGKTTTFTPQKTRIHENFVKMYVSSQPHEYYDTELLFMSIKIFLPLPKSKYRKRNPVKEQFCKGRRDLDNMVKSIKDALQGVLYKNDNQICQMYLAKYYAAQGEPGRIEIEIENVNYKFFIDWK